MTKEYRTQMKPVAARAERTETLRLLEVKRDRKHHVPTFWETLSLSAGRVKSLSPAPTKHHFMRGDQKNTVLGPAKGEQGLEKVDRGRPTSRVVHESLEL